ncbi:uncharacterized protein LOC112268600 [Brachypodium distachyon]|uniref:uncharacterized protein LOC112268600 n=1 Tax=Brachypodium distachyon TaxID=15368 RepID=UPI000D0E206A|nr:uncharacterized protein LOC112268600 [Brachypodium distachyon]|eukprot:XP_024310192.1 uncharacterized protein LOC112268600 [Brachypodium distachyon]
MKGLFWNSEGLRDPAKHRLIQENIHEQQLDFIALFETGRSNFTGPFLKHLASGLAYEWYVLPPHGRSGGILVGFNTINLQVKRVDTGDYCIKFHLRSKFDGFEWVLVPVYGAAQNIHKSDFLAELVRICESEPLPLVVGGDFNIIRRQEEKNNDNFNARWPFIFNAIIESLDLREIVLSGRQYTWASRRDIPTYEKLDRVLTSVDWEQKFPLVTVHALTRASSDHTPLLLDSGDQAHPGNKAQFLFELSWLRQEGFYEIVAAEWAVCRGGSSPIERWQNKIRHLRRFLRGWAKNQSGLYKKERDRLLHIIDTLDVKAESSPLSATERDALRDANDFVSKLRRDEESKWAQRAKVKYVQEGGSNAKEIHLVANGKHRKKKIFQLEQDEGIIVGQDNLRVFITDYYKKLFGTLVSNSFSLMEENLQGITLVTLDENNILVADFTEKEVHDSIF